jgi:hypothetical protein
VFIGLSLLLPALINAQSGNIGVDRNLSGKVPASSYPQRKGALSEREMAMATTAWIYFENNYNLETGLVNAVDNYPSTTMWDTASYLGALVAARELKIIDKAKFDSRMVLLLKTMNTMVLFRSEMPNKVYHTKTAAKVDYGNNPGEIGFSALDLGRLLIWFKIIKERYPAHANAIDNVVLRWDFSNAVDKNGTLFGALVDKDKKTSYVQEGRLGYEEYSAKGFQLWGFHTDLAAMPEPYNTTLIYGVSVPYDVRDPRVFSQHNYVVSESYVLEGVELNWDHPYDRSTDDRKHSLKWLENFGNRVYQAQENRFRETGFLTARSEHQLDRDPYFVYDTIYTDGYPWNTITEDGKHVPQYAAISLKAALGLWVLWESPYTDLLFDAISDNFDPKKGYYEGIYENGTGAIKTQTANNNGIMLEALLSKVQGKLLKWGPVDGGIWESTNADPYLAHIKNRPFFVRRKEPPAFRAKSLLPFSFGASTDSVDPICSDACSGGQCSFRSSVVSSCQDQASQDYSPSWVSLRR